MKSNFLLERGQALILIALAAIGLFGLTGLAIDGSAKFSDRRHAQNAADAAALAAALAYGDKNPDWLIIGAQSAYDNGYTDNHVSNEVEVYRCDDAGATCGAYDGSTQYVQVVITSHVNTYFARVVGMSVHRANPRRMHRWVEQCCASPRRLVAAIQSRAATPSAAAG